jgi:hypothetical protein
MIERVVSRIMIAWMVMVGTTISLLYRYANPTDVSFYRFGPSSTLIIMGFVIDRMGLYIGVISYCIINSMIRTACHDLLLPWLTHRIQDPTAFKPPGIAPLAYEITMVTAVYFWMDWFIYLNILLSQIDMLLAEIVADLMVSVLVTRYYLHHSPEVHLAITPGGTPAGTPAGTPVRVPLCPSEPPTPMVLESLREE